jgi:hypothetical protein
LVATSRPAIDPAISTLPVMNQLIAKVSNVPRVRQLMALRTDLVCVSAPRNEPTRDAPLFKRRQNLARRRLLHVRRGSSTAARNTFAAAPRMSSPKMARSPTETLCHDMHFTQRSPTNSLIRLNNRDSTATATRLESPFSEPDQRSDRASSSDNIQQSFSHRPAQSAFGTRRTIHICSRMGDFLCETGLIVASEIGSAAVMCDGRRYRSKSVFFAK